LHVFKNVKIADNANGFTHASGAFGRYAFTSRVVDSLFVGESENIGNPQTAAEKAYGRSLPKPELPDFPIRGYEYYDYRHDIVNTTFRNFQDNATRKTGAISNLLYSSFGVSTNNAMEKVKFENAKPVYFPPYERKWGNDNGGQASFNTAAYKDRDGSLGYGPGYVVIHDGRNNSIAVDDEACQIKADWNAAVCKGDIGRVSFGGGGGGGGFGAPRGGGGPGAHGGPGAAPRAGAPGPGGAGAAGPGPGFGAGPGPGAAPGAGAGPGAAPARGAAGPGGAPGGARAGGPGGAPGGARAGGAGGAPAQPPIILSRNGKEFTITGASNVRAGTEIKVTTERPSLNLSAAEFDAGSWLIFELPGFTTAATGTAVDSVDALRKASATSYYKGNGSLWVKLVSPGDSGTGAPGGGASLQVSR
jgi:hypothetical protein